MQADLARRESHELMERAAAVIVTTIDRDGFPQTRAMFNLRNARQFPLLAEFFDAQDDFSVFLTTNTSSAKVAHIRANPKVSVYYCDPAEFQGLMLGGEISIVDGEAGKSVKEALWQENWRMYYPGGASDPDHTVLCLRPSLARYYHRLNYATFQPGDHK